MENSENLTVEKDPVEPIVSSKMRQIVIETDGNNIKLVSADVSGRIELIAILQNLINYLNTPK